MEPKSLLVIGGTGFFGKSILKYLSNNSLLNIKISKIFILSRRKLELAIYNKKLRKKFKIIKINSNILTIKSLPKVDYVIYAAILKNYKNDHKAVKNYLNLAKKNHLKSKILYISSGAVYGNQLQSIKGFKENYLQFNNKISFKKSYKKVYSKIKLKNEKLFQQFGKVGAKVSIARCFSFVGPDLSLKTNYVIGNIINNILRNENIIIKANYKIIRSYMYSDDLVRWLFKILDHSNKLCPIFNVGSDNKVSIHKTANVLAKKYNLEVLSPKISSKKIDNYIPNINKARKELNLTINNDSLGAIQKTINFHLKNCNKQI
jgi:nucleoside-diphosphate-sugar epimerase